MALRLAVLAALLLLTACAGVPADPAAVKGALTAQDAALADRLLQRTLEYAPDGTTRRWQNDQTGHSGSITPVATYLATGGIFCRDYREELSAAGRSAAAVKAACRDRLARWIAL
jgi:surface antigen